MPRSVGLAAEHGQGPRGEGLQRLPESARGRLLAQRLHHLAEGGHDLRPRRRQERQPARLYHAERGRVGDRGPVVLQAEAPVELIKHPFQGRPLAGVELLPRGGKQRPDQRPQVLDLGGDRPQVVLVGVGDVRRQGDGAGVDARLRSHGQGHVLPAEALAPAPVLVGGGVEHHHLGPGKARLGGQRLGGVGLARARGGQQHRVPGGQPALVHQRQALGGEVSAPEGAAAIQQLGCGEGEEHGGAAAVQVAPGDGARQPQRQRGTKGVLLLQGRRAQREQARCLAPCGR